MEGQLPIEFTELKVQLPIDFVELEGKLPIDFIKLDEEYCLPKWLDFNNLPRFATKNGKRLSVKDNKPSIDRYNLFREYFKGASDEATPKQIESLLGIKISDYDWTNKKEQIQSEEFLFQKIKGTFVDLERNYSLPDWINCDTLWPKPVDKVNDQLVKYFLFLVDEIENMPYTDELLKAKVSDIKWPFDVPNSEGEKLLFRN